MYNLCTESNTKSLQKNSSNMNKTTFKALAATLLIAAISTSALARPFDVSGKAVYVDDGDTLVLLVDGKDQMKVRLSSIDAPESSHTNKQTGRVGQPYSDNSGKYLAGLVKGKAVDAHCFEEDRYKRNVCELFVDGKSVNKELVKQGWAWANLSANGRYLRDKSLPELEASARQSKAGLWAGANPVAPWEWRDLCWKQGKC
jgi:endonuclease YncB( thermonuclease family)